MNILAKLHSAADRLSTGKKLASAFALLLALTAALGVGALVALARVNQASDELASKWLPSVGHLSTARASLLEYREFEVKVTTAADAGYMSEYEEKMVAALKPATASIAAHAALVSQEDEKTLTAAFDKQLQGYVATSQKVLALAKGNQQVDAKDISEGAGKSGFDDAIMALDKISAYSFESGEASADASASLYAKSKLGVMVLVGVALVAGVLLALGLTRNLLRQLGGEPRMAAEQLQRIAAGDLASLVQVREGDATSLMAGLKKMQQDLAEVVSSVRQGSENVATASAEIAQGNNDLSSRTETQASALQQTAASMGELNAQVNYNADSARKANELANQASAVAVQGGGAVGGVVATMKGISDSSARIAEIIGVIDSIAFQTNILALNAAVEAARAGEQGRGFAVVAAEVRSLAQRSATAAKEIKNLINASVEQIQLGSSQVNQAGATMTQVVQAIQQVNQIVNEISAASGAQSASVRQVGDAITQMDQTTQQNAALVEESAAAAESLRNQAQQLVEAVAFFKVNA